MLYQLVYSSVALQWMDREALAAVAEQARRNNTRLGVTGALLYFERTREFLQVLEGERDTVHALMKIISADPRHGGVVIAFEGALENRCFAGWSMGFHIQEGQTLADLAAHSGGTGEALRTVRLPGRSSEAATLLDLMRQSIEAG